MKRIVTTLAVAAILLLGCDTGEQHYPEVYLTSVRLDLYLNSPAQVTGYLAQGVSLHEALENIDAARLRNLNIRCSVQDSIDIEPIVETMIIPVSVSTTDFTGATAVSYSQDGITWTPRYSWAETGGLVRFDATITISNVSDRRWTAAGLTMMDGEGMPVCGIPDSVIIPENDMVLRWWSAEGYALQTSLVYGWPSHARWNLLNPILVEEPGFLLGQLGGLPEWPRRTGDTLWIPPEEDILLTENLMQHPRGYNGTLDIENRTGRPLSLQLVYPDVLPRGAGFKVEADPSGNLSLGISDKVRLEYTISYP